MGALLPAVDLGAGHRIVGIQVGTNASCAILNKGRLKCWGQNDYGALGLGHTRDIGDGPGEMGDALPFIEL
jgi:alpha-tubulin suppressor-like RCC1 family protein